MHFVTVVRIYNMHQDTKSAQLIAICKRTLSKRGIWKECKRRKGETDFVFVHLQLTKIHRLFWETCRMCNNLSLDPEGDIHFFFNTIFVAYVYAKVVCDKA